MDREEIHLGDIKRILLGETPPVFLAEVFIRTLVVYVAFTIVMRWLGKRMAGQLTIIEIAVMITLGAIISPAMQTPDKGILLGMFILLCALFFQRGLTLLNFKSERFEALTQGTVMLLVEDGVLKLDELKKSRITRQQVYAFLRSSGILNLGAVERLYIEGCGRFSMYKNATEKAGLPLMPPDDVRLLKEQKAARGAPAACICCGNTVPHRDSVRCQVCNGDEWTEAIEKVTA